MPDDDLTFGQLLFRCGGGRPSALRETIAGLKIEPRHAGAATFYTQEQAEAIKAAHHIKADTRKSRTRVS